VAEPDKLLIPYADYEHSRFHHVGRYGPGNLFMASVTGAFPGDWWSGRYPPESLNSRWAEHKCWYAVLHRYGPSFTILTRLNVATVDTNQYASFECFGTDGTCCSSVIRASV
jgi:hypothetical protein